MKLLNFTLALIIAVSDVYAQKYLSIAEVQGDGNTSPVVGQSVRLTGVVTARTKTGFFLQTPDDKADSNKNTSEGIFVFTRTQPPAEADLGNIVSVTGMVEEFRRESDTLASTITELSMRKGRDEIKVISPGNATPKPIALTANDFMSNTVYNLEKYEGMRVQIDEMTVSAPTGGRVDVKNFSSVSDGTFWGVVKPLPRPFRQPGRDTREFATPADREQFKKTYPKAVVFDSNPDVIRVDCDAQTQPLTQRIAANNCEVPAMASVKNLVGVLHYAFGKYTVLPDTDNRPAISSAAKANPFPVPNDRQFAVVGMNIENFFDDQDDPGIQEDVATTEAFDRRLRKISTAVWDIMRLPDVIGIVEAENLNALKRLAAKVNADAVNAGRPDPKYEAFLIEGNDGRGIDNGFLVKTSRVKVIETKQFGKDEKYKNPNTKEDVFLNDRPPLMLRASIADSKTGQPFEFTVFVNHLKSYSGYNDPKQSDNVRLKKKLQAEYLAKLVQSRQQANPKERIILIGDFNSYQFADGILDQIGTITGKPAGRDEVTMPSEDLVNPDLIDLVGSIAEPQRYSFIFDGNAQVLDHIIVTENMRKHTRGFGYARVNADYPESFRGDAGRIERFSDHDPAAAFFTMDDMTPARGQ
jgi:predicted extracellular nuclease